MCHQDSGENDISRQEDQVLKKTVELDESGVLKTP